MATETSYKGLEKLRFPVALIKRTEDNTFSKFTEPKRQHEFKEYGSINHIEFSGNQCSVSASVRVNMYNYQGRVASFSKFSDVVYCASFRRDGRLFVTGCQDSTVRIWDSQKSTTSISLRNLDGHDGAVRVAKFLDNQHIFTCSDDRTVRYWDVVVGQEIAKLEGHQDYVRAGVKHPTNNNLVVTGGYDHQVYLWDLRSGQRVATMDHGAQVEGLVVFPNGGMVASCGDNYVRVWDIFNSGKQMFNVSKHQKVITAMCLNENGTRLLTGGLDRIVKVYDTSDYTVVQNLYYQFPITALDLSKDERDLAVGSAEGHLVISHVNKPVKAAAQKEVNKGVSYRYRKGTSNDDVTILSTRTKRLEPYDQYLKKFQYRTALDIVLDIPTKNVEKNKKNKGQKKKKPYSTVVVMSMIEELRARNGLEIALSGRTMRDLTKILDFILKNIRYNPYVPSLIDVTNIIIDMYGHLASEHQEMAAFIRSLEIFTKDELAFQRGLHTVIGFLDAFMYVSTTRAEAAADTLE
eukprot:GEZU01009752.1.p1 GENE.GEZU01009752.1~~GEZU01009752.1.p1  ORF type:complete len:532 (-),score=98.55 GEZU01009752.1:57-1616(-)